MNPVGMTARTLAQHVQQGDMTASEVVRAHLDHLADVEHRLGAFVSIRRRGALDDAAALDGRADLGDLPLAGVPLAVKDAFDVVGEPTRRGSEATDGAPAIEDHPVVARLRAAGAIIVGKTRMPELGLWGTSDDSTGTAVSPWDPTRTAGGSSGGSAAAVAAGVVPLALGDDGLGSVRIPAAACGVFGFKPGADMLSVVAQDRPHWFGMSRFGPLATTVDDAALMTDVMTGSTNFAAVGAVEERLRVAVSFKAPAPGVAVTAPWKEAAIEAGRLLNHAGHIVERVDPPYEQSAIQAALARWTQGALEEVNALELDRSVLQPRTRGHLSRAEQLIRVRAVREDDAQRWFDRVAPFFEDHDVLITPAFARTQPASSAWHTKPWVSNVAVTLSTYPFLPPWNLADLPTAAVPLWHDAGRPLSVQIVAGRGREDLVLAVASKLASMVSWTRHAPGWGVPRH